MADEPDERHLRAQRLAAQRLSGTPASAAEDVVDHLLAVQAEDGRGFRWAVHSRSVGLRPPTWTSPSPNGGRWSSAP